MNRLLLGLVFVLFTHALVSTSYGELIANGSFEAPAGVAAGSYADVEVPGWTTGTGLLFHTEAPHGIDNQDFTWPLPQDGEQYYDIGNQSLSAITQLVTIATPGTFELSWYDHTAILTSATSSPYLVTIFEGTSTNVVASGSFDAYNIPRIWTRSSLSASLAAGTYTVQFSANNNPTGLDSLIDNVSLAAVVPEPGTVFLALVGALASIARRHRGSARRTS